MVLNDNFNAVANTLAPKSVQAIITDPPYGEKFIHIYQEIGSIAERLLTDSGVLVIQLGSCFTHEMRLRLALHLRIVCEPIVVLTGSRARLQHSKIFLGHRKILVMARRDKSHYQAGYINDTLYSEYKDKEYDAWGFPAEPLLHFLDHFTKPGDTVFDPCAGGGSTGEACLATGRKFIGCDINPLAVAACQMRLNPSPVGYKQKPTTSFPVVG